MDNKEKFLELAALLLEKEVIFADDMERIFGPRADASASQSEDGKTAEGAVIAGGADDTAEAEENADTAAGDTEDMDGQKDIKQA